MLMRNTEELFGIDRPENHDLILDLLGIFADQNLEYAVESASFLYFDSINSCVKQRSDSYLSSSRSNIKDFIEDAREQALQWLNLDYADCCQIGNQISRVNDGFLISSSRNYSGLTPAEGGVRVHVERLSLMGDLIVAKVERFHSPLALPAIELENNVALLIAEDTERRRVARELHDGTSQHVALAQILLEKLRGERSFAQIDAAVAQIELTVASAQREIQLLELGCQPCELERCSLAGAIAAFLKRFSAHTSLRTRFTDNLGSLALSRDLQCAIFRIVQEAVVNVERHADAHVVELTLSETSGQIILEITDDGIGIPDDIAKGCRAEALGVGLSGMRARTKMLSGSFSISSHGAGTCILARFPKSIKTCPTAFGTSDDAAEI